MPRTAARRAGKTARVRPLRDEKGRTHGFTIETKDGRQAAVVRPDPVRMRVSVTGKDR